MAAARERLRRLSFRGFRALDRARLHVLPKHYYSSVPDHAWLRANKRLWQRPAPLVGVRWDLDEQLEWLRAICGRHYAEAAGLGEYARHAASGFGPGFGQIESQVLHCFVRARAPARIVEVGGGVSTAVMAAAGARNRDEGRPAPRIVTVEPHPRPALEALEGVELVREPAQGVSTDVFADLSAGDLLFIDSTHAVRTGSEVLRLYLEIVPGLAPGVTVHVHDVTLPYLFEPRILETFFDWQETSLVLALLTGNEHLRVACSLSALHHERPDELREILADYRPRPTRAGLFEPDGDGHFPSSLWLETV